MLLNKAKYHPHSFMYFMTRCKQSTSFFGNHIKVKFLNGIFVFAGLLLWNQTRQQWVGNKKSEKQTQPRESMLRLEIFIVFHNFKVEKKLIGIKRMQKYFRIPWLTNFLHDLVLHIIFVTVTVAIGMLSMIVCMGTLSRSWSHSHFL